MEWKEVRLGDVCSIQRGASPRPIQKFISKVGMPWVKIADATGISSRYISSTSEYIIKEGVSKSRIVYPGDLIVSNSATPGLPKFMAIEACVHDGWLIIRDFDGIDKVFLYYVFLNIRRRLSNQANGSVFMNLKTDIVKDFVIKLPTLDAQRRIASVLSSIDRKIDLNNKINADLEEMAQAIFKNWFVDFEPFKDGEFVDSELGMIPEGWKVGRLDEIADVVGGSTPSKAKPEYYTLKGIAWLTPKDLSNHPAVYSSRGEIDITQEGYNSTSTKLMPKGTVLFTSRAPIGYISIAQNDICTNQGFKSVVPKKAGTSFLYCFLKYVTPEIENKSTGSTFKEASGALMKSLQVIMPEQKVFEEFEAIVSPLFTRIESLEKESSRLSLLRDTLLPRLMSGELEVPE